MINHCQSDQKFTCSPNIYKAGQCLWLVVILIVLALLFHF